MLENKKNVLFDMDGLLIDSEALGIKMWEKVFAQHNEPFNPEAAYKTIGSNGLAAREFDSCLQFFTNQIAQNVDYINAFEFFYCQICENNCTNMG